MALVMDSLALCLLVLISVAIADKASLDWGFDSDAQLEEFLRKRLYSQLADDFPFMTTPPLKEASFPYSSSVLSGISKPNVDKLIVPRVPENEENPPKGFSNQYVSGGAGEGKQQLHPDGSVDNVQETKTDADLPSYCSPPNPCPKGKTAADGCQENIPDTVEFNRRYQRYQMTAGLCSCDEEHMQSSCGEDSSSEADFTDIYGYLDESKLGKNNPYISVGEKRMSLSGKKGRERRSAGKGNPYLQGNRLPVVAKKSPQI